MLILTQRHIVNFLRHAKMLKLIQKCHRKFTTFKLKINILIFYSVIIIYTAVLNWSLKIFNDFKITKKFFNIMQSQGKSWNFVWKLGKSYRILGRDICNNPDATNFWFSQMIWLQIINGHVVTINETVYSKNNSIGGAVFRVRIIDVKPQNETEVIGGGSTEQPSVRSEPDPESRETVEEFNNEISKNTETLTA